MVCKNVLSISSDACWMTLSAAYHCEGPVPSSYWERAGPKPRAGEAGAVRLQLSGTVPAIPKTFTFIKRFLFLFLSTFFCSGLSWIRWNAQIQKGTIEELLDLCELPGAHQSALGFGFERLDEWFEQSRRGAFVRSSLTLSSVFTCRLAWCA